MGIVWLDSKCRANGSHYLIEYEKVDKGSIFKCIYCHKIRWLPTNIYDAYKLSRLIERFGCQEGYCHFLNLHRSAKIMVAKLQELERLSGIVKDKLEFARIADRILSEKDYDKKEVEA